MGGAFARKLSGFGAKVIAYDKYKTNFSDSYATECSLEQLWADADIVSLHVPLTDETRFMVDDRFLASFRKNIILLNTARGKVVRTADLVTHLRNGKVVAAGLDVLEYEKTSFEELHRDGLPADFEFLVQAENVLLSPHVAGWTHESNRKLAEVIASKMIAVLRSSTLHGQK